jgi:hypothetical protein
LLGWLIFIGLSLSAAVALGIGISRHQAKEANARKAIAVTVANAPKPASPRSIPASPPPEVQKPVIEERAERERQEKIDEEAKLQEQARRLKEEADRERAQAEKERDDLKAEGGLLAPWEKKKVELILTMLRARQYEELDALRLETDQCAGEFIASHSIFFKGERDLLVKWAEATGVEELIENLGLEKSDKLQQVKIAFALLDNLEPKIIFSNGRPHRWPANRRPDKKSAVRIAAFIKAHGMDKLPQDMRDFVKSHRDIFVP